MVTHVYGGPDLASSADFIKGHLFTTYLGELNAPSEIAMAGLTS